MEHCAIDLGGRKSQVCVRASDGTIVHESRPETLALKEFLQGRPKSRVIVETCAEAFGVADAALALGHEVRVVICDARANTGRGGASDQNRPAGCPDPERSLLPHRPALGACARAALARSEDHLWNA